MAQSQVAEKPIKEIVADLRQSGSFSRCHRPMWRFRVASAQGDNVLEVQVLRKRIWRQLQGVKARRFETRAGLILQQEAEERRIVLVGDPATIELLLDYLYTQDYNVKPGEQKIAERHAELFICGDYYGLPTLKTLALEKYIKSLDAASKPLTAIIHKVYVDIDATYTELRGPLLAKVHSNYAALLLDEGFQNLLSRKDFNLDLHNTSARQLTALKKRLVSATKTPEVKW